MIAQRKLVLALSILLLAGCSHFAAPVPHEAGGLEKLQWLVGDWVSEGTTNITYESWQWQGDQLEGVGRSKSRASGEIRVTETLQLLSRNGDILYIPTVAHNPGPVPFTLVQHSPTRFVFENPAHDFPKRIVYERIADDRIRVTVSGDDGAGFAIEFGRLR